VQRRRRGARYGEAEAREAIAASFSITEALRRLGMRGAGGNGAVLRRWAEQWGIDMGHFDPHARRREANRTAGRRRRIPLEEILVDGSTYSRHDLKRRLFEAGLKQRSCELCGQGELWRGRPMSLILDHINGVATDHRLENLRIVCPNCNATLDTHCGRNKTRVHHDRECLRCGGAYRPYGQEQRYCSIACAAAAATGVSNIASRRVERPPEARLLEEIAALGYSAVGRRYGVSDNAVRKWVRHYAREREAAAALEARPADAPDHG
jgi:hypothetical protein